MRKHLLVSLAFPKFVAFVLMLTLVLSFGAVAFAAGSPTVHHKSNNGGTTTSLPKATFELDLYDGSDDSLVEEIDRNKIVYAPVGYAGLLLKADREAFLKAYEDVKAVKDKVVKYFFWLDIKGDYNVPAGDYLRYDFTCKGENVQVQVNGKDMEVVNVEGDDYYAKLTELGSVSILCD